MVRSKLAVASRRPSGLNPSETTSAECPVRVWRTRPLLASRMITELTEYSLLRDASASPRHSPADATSLPSGLVTLNSAVNAFHVPERAAHEIGGQSVRTWSRPAQRRVRR